MVTGTTKSAGLAAITRDEFIDSRNIQDGQINAELSSIRQAISDTTHELKADIHHAHTQLADDINNAYTHLKNDIDNVYTELKDEITRVEAQIADVRTELKDEIHLCRTELKEDITLLRVEFEREKAFNHNSRLRNPTFRIEPIVALHPDGPVWPDKRFFPRNAGQFYSLREPISARRVQKLVDLVQFYDIPYSAWHANDDDHFDYESYDSDAEDSDDSPTPAEQPELSLEDAVLTYPKRAVEALEIILGLNEENFINFRTRALQLKSDALAAKRPARNEQHGQPAPAKRVMTSLFDRKVTLDQKAPSRPRETNPELWEQFLKEGQEKEASDKSTESPVYWDEGSFRRRNQEKMRNLAARGARSSEGSPTNADTLSREGRSPRPQTPI